MSGWIMSLNPIVIADTNLHMDNRYAKSSKLSLYAKTEHQVRIAKRKSNVA